MIVGFRKMKSCNEMPNLRVRRLQWSPACTSYHLPQYVFEPEATSVGTGAGVIGVMGARTVVGGGTNGFPGAETHIWVPFNLSRL